MTYELILEQIALVDWGLLSEASFRAWLEEALSVAAEYDRTAMSIWEGADFYDLEFIKSLVQEAINKEVP